MKIKFLFIITSLLFISCHNDECYEPSRDIILEFVNTNGDNLIENGELDVSTISINKILSEDEQFGVHNNVVEGNKLKLNNEISRFDGIQKFIFSSNLNLFTFEINSGKVNDCDAYYINYIIFDSVYNEKQNDYYRITLY
ncbi:hypothetical protein [Faecalibacter rhinopitheci]|uniref:Uncharacterized protein n=1 Tax=Faecalibacter rhinopitheci TaxID=2779678 RepID=A0A8J7FV10_9FLAO|nr:hypothetical protein [Faecalibacter rhinopitheci]MBF0598317.1 hypothetical protein [Faecalibacter rhinopitheci]